MTTNDNNNERIPKRRRTSNATETKQPIDTPSNTSGSVTPNTLIQLQNLIEHNEDIWTDKQKEIVESLALYAHKD
eukprot:CAMPEP_0202446370 /NCGR_PEP_ID=MMETSP1360-20130828/4874_1 /ASSEMBLY_ACC=CAM_ASM_000848 /TAXON_ID=515479 /ORGANISM="Licmophora paradoxa, Strain CCMP2313" /LENGTH=74 /DNA_ID=CAMNT_0049062821 /DNA_START=57 /DNA_END=278 /DNA_ORIENTATION=+